MNMMKIKNAGIVQRGSDHHQSIQATDAKHFLRTIVCVCMQALLKHVNTAENEQLDLSL